MDYNDLPNLASPQIGSRILFATDEWFAAAENVIKDEDAVWKQDDFTPFGKWMDGWETRRRRTEGHDWAIIQLGIPGIIRAIEVDTAYFTGNFSPVTSIYGVEHVNQATSAVERLLAIRKETAEARPEFGRMGLKATDEEFALVKELKSESWVELVPLSPLRAGYEATRRTIFTVTHNGPISVLRLNMGPDGGIARIRVYGEVVIQPERIPFNRDVDLVAIENGGMAVSCSNKHYGHIRNLITPGRGNCMGDGWETARQPKRPPVYKKGADGLMVLPGYDWTVLQLGVAGTVTTLDIDTHFYKGNYPESCLVEVCNLPKDTNTIQKLLTEDNHSQIQWKALLPRTRLGPDVSHLFTESQLQAVGVFTHMKVTIFPDGGIMRIRVWGKKSPESKL